MENYSCQPGLGKQKYVLFFAGFAKTSVVQIILLLYRIVTSLAPWVSIEIPDEIM